MENEIGDMTTKDKMRFIITQVERNISLNYGWLNAKYEFESSALLFISPAEAKVLAILLLKAVEQIDPALLDNDKVY